MLILNQRNFIITCGLLLCLIVPLTAYGEIIFQENFDNIPDWQVQTTRDSCSAIDCSDVAPGQWDLYNNDELWMPPEYPNSHPSSVISNEQYRGSSGKAYIHWCESNKGATNDGWGNDGILAKDLIKEYDELYVQMYIKYQQNFQWRTDPGSGLKQVRIYHWDHTGSSFSFGKDRTTGPVFFFYPGHNSYYDSKFEINARCSPPSEYYTCGMGTDSFYYYNGPFSGQPSFMEFIGDGEWHKYVFHIKNNSSPGIRDGIIEIYIDDILQYDRKDIAWMSNQETSHVGFNVVAIGGNVNNLYADESNHAEQWYAIDDVIVSTTPITENNTSIKIIEIDLN